MTLFDNVTFRNKIPGLMHVYVCFNGKIIWEEKSLGTKLLIIACLVFLVYKEGNGTFSLSTWSSHSCHFLTYFSSLLIHFGLIMIMQAGPSFAAQQPVMYNPPAAPMTQQYYHPNGPQVCCSLLY